MNICTMQSNEMFSAGVCVKHLAVSDQQQVAAVLVQAEVIRQRGRR